MDKQEKPGRKIPIRPDGNECKRDCVGCLANGICVSQDPGYGEKGGFFQAR